MKPTQWINVVLATCLILGLVTFTAIKIDQWCYSDETLRLTQNSEFVVEKVRGGQQWEYRLKNLNLHETPDVRILIIETDKPMGYHRGDTLRLLHHGDYSE